MWTLGQEHIPSPAPTDSSGQMPSVCEAARRPLPWRRASRKSLPGQSREPGKEPGLAPHGLPVRADALTTYVPPLLSWLPGLGWGLLVGKGGIEGREQ